MRASNENEQDGETEVHSWHDGEHDDSLRPWDRTVQTSWLGEGEQAQRDQKDNSNGDWSDGVASVVNDECAECDEADCKWRVDAIEEPARKCPVSVECM